MRIFGLTGPSGAGKGEVGAILRERGLAVIDTDRVYHELLIPPSPCLDALVDAFGRDILTEDGTLDRAMLASLVFADTDKARERHETLNRITHRFVTERTSELLDAYRAEGYRAAVIDAPLLLEAGMDAICEAVIAVIADREVRLGRLLARDNKSREALVARLDAQPDDAFYRERARFVIENNGTRVDLERAVDAVLTDLGGEI
ncbi:MAG: dephospho-CoA kinase [Clostridia bacterium]|nr:dephospho-CoA kinase [Clostridia bacterium]